MHGNNLDIVGPCIQLGEALIFVGIAGELGAHESNKLWSCGSAVALVTVEIQAKVEVCCTVEEGNNFRTKLTIRS